MCGFRCRMRRRSVVGLQHHFHDTYHRLPQVFSHATAGAGQAHFRNTGECSEDATKLIDESIPIDLFKRVKRHETLDIKHQIARREAAKATEKIRSIREQERSRRR